MRETSLSGIVILVFLVLLLAGLGQSQYERDEDFHHNGTDTAPSSPPPEFNGKVNKLEDSSNQLEPGMNTTAFGMSSPASDPDTELDGQQNVDSPDDAKWHDSMGTQDRADQWAITLFMNYSLSNRGVPYSPGATYYHDDYSGPQRSDAEDDSVSKTVKVFGNSYAAEATTSWTDQKGDTVEIGDGVWIDPDQLRKWSLNGKIRRDWRMALSFGMDLSGPDSGIGINTDDNDDITYTDAPRNWVMYGNIYFEGEKDTEDNDGDGDVDEGASDTSTVGETVPLLEPPMCGDDQKEFLLEEAGEVENSGLYDGRYACADSRAACVYMDAPGKKLFEDGDTIDVRESGERWGRLKQDEEICLEDSLDSIWKWWDQDYGNTTVGGGQDTCQQNTLYGSQGVRWFDSGYVTTYPFAVQGGIDDDWNQYLRQRWADGDITDNLTSNPSHPTYDYDADGTPDYDPDGDGEWEISPVSSGELVSPNPNRTIASMGFCGGDDDGEHLVTQRCNTRLCDNNNSVIGVAKTDGSCILEGSSYPVPPDKQKRMVYEPGENVTFNFGSDSRTIACFQNVWYEEWPIVFEEDSIEVGLGETRKVNFQLINVESQARTFDVELQNTPVSQWVSFVGQGGDGFNTTIPARSSRTFQAEIYGGNENIDASDLRVQADVQNSAISGEDSVVVDILSSSSTNTTGGVEVQTRNVPGIGMVHLIVILLVSGILVFTQS